MRKTCFTFLILLTACISFSQDSLWRLTGNAGTASAHFLGTTDGRPLFFRVNNSLSGWIDNGVGNNTTFGFQAGASINAGSSNSLFGYRAGRSLTAGQRNTGLGHSALYTNTNGSYNTATGYAALFSNVTGTYNTANGVNALYTNITGVNNSAFGGNALRNNTAGVENTAVGYQSLQANGAGNYNTGLGVNTLYNNVAGHNNVAVGHRAMFFNTIGGNNAAVGVAALVSNTTGMHNIAVGHMAMYNNTTGYNNVVAGSRAMYNAGASNFCVAIGDSSMYSNPSSTGNTAVGAKTLMTGLYGEYNTAMGYSSLRRNLTRENTSVGAFALGNNIYGWGNTVVGYNAMGFAVRGDRNAVLGNSAFYGNEMVWADANVVVGYRAGTHDADWLDFNTFVGPFTEFQKPGLHDTCRNSTALGNSALITASDQVRIGNSNVSSIGGFANWSNISDSRFKKNVQQNVPGLEFILQLKPVTYNLDITGLNEWLGFNNNTDRPKPDENSLRQKEGALMTGFLAQEVEAAAKQVKYNFSGIDAPKNESDLYALRYAEFVVPLVKAVQEQQQMIETLKNENNELKQQLQQIRIRLGMETIITKASK